MNRSEFVPLATLFALAGAAAQTNPDEQEQERRVAHAVSIANKAADALKLEDEPKRGTFTETTEPTDPAPDVGVEPSDPNVLRAALRGVFARETGKLIIADLQDMCGPPKYSESALRSLLADLVADGEVKKTTAGGIDAWRAK